MVKNTPKMYILWIYTTRCYTVDKPHGGNSRQAFNTVVQIGKMQLENLILCVCGV